MFLPFPLRLASRSGGSSLSVESARSVTALILIAVRLTVHFAFSRLLFSPLSRGLFSTK
jgi:hypothetical protein